MSLSLLEAKWDLMGRVPGSENFAGRIATAIEKRAKDLGTSLVPLTNDGDLNVLGWVNPDGSFGGVNFRTVREYSNSYFTGEVTGSLTLDPDSHYGLAGGATRDNNWNGRGVPTDESRIGVIYLSSPYYYGYGDTRNGSISPERLTQIALVAERGRVEPKVSGVPTDIVVFA